MEDIGPLQGTRASMCSREWRKHVDPHADEWIYTYAPCKMLLLADSTSSRWCHGLATGERESVYQQEFAWLRITYGAPGGRG